MEGLYLGAVVHALSLPIPVSFPVLRVISSGSVNGKIAVSYQITAIMFFLSVQ